MHRRTIYLALIGGLAVAIPAAALGGPWDGSKGKAKQPDKHSMQVRMLAGKGRLGVSVLELSPELRAHFGAPRDRGVLINTVRPDSPAARAGVAVGDVVTEVDDDAVDRPAEMLKAMSDRKKGESVSVGVIRNGRSLTLKAQMEDDPGSFDVGVTPDAWRDLDRGFQLGPPDADGAFRRELDRAQKRIQELEKRLEKLEHR